MDNRHFNKNKLIIIVLMITFSVIFGMMIVSASSTKLITYNFNPTDQYVGSYKSNRYTQADDLSENPSDGAKLRLEAQDNGNFDELVASNNRFEMYFNRYLNIIKLKNRLTGYVWASAVDSFDFNDIKSIRYANELGSSVIIGYYFYNQTNDTYVDTQFSYLNKVSFDLINRTIKIEPNKNEVTVISTVADNVIKLQIKVQRYQVGLNAYFELNDTGLAIRVPDAEMTEAKNLISSIYLAPAFGSTRNNEEPGYMVIPDGSGALIRYGQSSGTQTYLKYYGTDYGIKTILENSNLNKEKVLSAPIFGLVNGIRQDAVLGIIESGSYSADLLVSLNGMGGTNYNYMTPIYLIRQQYLLYGANPTVETNRNGDDIIVNYLCMDGDEATYVGMAQKYQQYLIDHDVLVKKQSEQYRMRLEMIMSETVPALIGTKNVTLTSIKELNGILSDLGSNGVTSLALVLKGWNSGGLSGNTPYNIDFNTHVGSTGSFKELIKREQSVGNPVYFYNDYLMAYDKGEASIRNDVARTIQRLKMSFTNPDAPLYQNYYRLYPEKSLHIASGDVNAYEKRQIGALAIDSLGNDLFSYYYKGTISHRQQAAAYYQDLTETLSERFDLALYNPNSYLWKNLDSYFDMPLYANQFSIYTDTVPFIPYVLKGCIDYYGSSINFYASPTDQLLRLVDFGAFPSYILTSQQSRALKYTNSNTLFATMYEDWNDSIIENYQKLEEVFKKTGSANVTDRQILKEGVVLVTYSNGLKIIINYTEEQFEFTNANSFSIIGGNV